ncbi:M15 family metallopeptidase [Rhodococcus sp. OK302]|jgi:zinc D-Ala-D-Ala carboxypeptidase|uniref:M15 family metallopeptidase n=1 Tax=Rhodococcus sp. OK302 TaxID=1882769 RepID=UPI000B9F28A4|nr:M15 family metallopeptidase [Rhodococcus sp. OK302]OYD61044.1 D-alanyl-D-alanine carboxypeptidase-like protein [Rhodococcus sp. OK302]
MPIDRRIICLLALGALTLGSCSAESPDQPGHGSLLRYLPDSDTSTDSRLGGGEIEDNVSLGDTSVDSGPAGGEIEDSISPYNTQLPALARLDPALLAALHSAAADAQKSGVAMHVTSGWRSAAFQQRLWDEAVVKYRSVVEAARWVHPPNLSKHVSGRAVDIGPTNADDWLIQHGSDYGLCQTYANEMWHFELATHPGGDCPPQLSNPSEEGEGA